MKKASKRKITFIVAWCCLILALRSEAQQGSSGSHLTMPGKLILDTVAESGSYRPGLLKPPELKPKLNPIASTPLHLLAADYYVQNFGFFCKRELEFEKKTHVPLKFRLGSLDYVNRLEGK